MTPGDRRTIEELAVLYELHPNRKDIYVEGPIDVSFFRWFLRQASSQSATVYEISTVEIPVDWIKQHNLEDNNRDRVITLAFLLASYIGEESLQITCIADRDLDLVLNRQHNCGLLLFTDYTCIEMYSFNEMCMDKFLNVFICGFPRRPAYVLQQLSLTLQKLFLIRLANTLLHLGLMQIPFKRCCRLKDGEIIFNAEDFINRYLNKNNMRSRKREFSDAIESCKSRLSNNPLHCMHGHDYINLLAWYLANHHVDRKLCDSEVVGRSLLESPEFNQLTNELLFKQLLDRVNEADAP
jgi:hypothetical protein